MRRMEASYPQTHDRNDCISHLDYYLAGEIAVTLFQRDDGFMLVPFEQEAYARRGWRKIGTDS